ncbi:hypothetical protein CDAR_620191 [Caerostris darwini]|uniref:Uncharacterized protein n=1 Tax=Caerostris darwini TaxID=1538125 RepID=A0AAV4VK36_9ARAC|nr:hypothetical protein CDAR_620191 [Caerostris darwini]
MGSRNVFWYSDPEFPKMGFRGTSSIKKVPNGNGGGASTAGLEDGIVKRKLACRSQQPTFFFVTVFFFLPLLQHFILFRIGGGGCSARVVLQPCARKGCSFRFASRVNEGVVEEIELS